VTNRDPRRCSSLIAIAIFVITVLSASATAWALDPALRWSTLETPHFAIHFHDGLEGFARRTATLAEAALARLSPFLDTSPMERIEVVISDSTDSANGSATVYPRALIRLNPTPPDNHSELNDFDDWLWSLLLHELTHVLHLGDIGGLPRIVNALIGQQWIPNAWQPNWVVEGFAIQAETHFTSGGRNRSALYDMQLRLMALENALPDLDDLSGNPSRWPRGVIPYLFGARFIDWIVQTHGPSVLASLSHDYGSAPIPFLLNMTALDILGKSWPQLYAAWLREVSTEALALEEALSAQGLTEVTPITASGERTGAPRFCKPSVSGEDRLCFIDAPGTRRPSLRSRALDGRDERVHAELFTTGELAISPDGRTAIVSQLVTFETDYAFEDLYRFDLVTGSRERLTKGQRASAPDFSPDGKSVAFIQRRRGGTTALARLALDTRQIETLVETPIGAALYSPRHAPNGRALAYAAQADDGRHLFLFDLDTGTSTQLTSGRALDLDPAFDPSGERLYFASDRSGIYDVFRLDLTTGQMARMTRLISGAFALDLSRDGARLALVVHSSRGADVALVEVETLHPLDTPLPEARPAPDVPKGRFESTEIHPYRPWRSLGARAWLPFFESDADSRVLGLTTFGNDAVGLHSWTFEGGVDLSARQPYAAVDYVYRGIRPELSLAGASHYVHHGYLFGAGRPERQWQARASATWPVAGPNFSLAFSLGYQLTLHQALALRSARGSSTSTLYPDNVRLAILYGSVGYSSVWTPTQGISPTEGWSLWLSLNGSHSKLGSARDYVTLSASATRYLAMPWNELHALALRVRGGIGWSPEGTQPPLFGLGGAGLSNPILDYIQNTSTSTTALRGYQAGAIAGTRFWMASAEYRLPIATLDWGVWTLPLYLRRLHGALTADAGWAGHTRMELSEVRPSIGAVLRLEALVRYDFGTQVQLGYAYGFGRDGIHNVYLGIGSGF
jgi:hypothetical protein